MDSFIDYDNFTLDDDIDYFYLSSEVDGSTADDRIKISKRAIDKILLIREENRVPDDFHLRISAKGGAPSGVNFDLVFDNEICPGDKLLQSPDFSFLIDSKTLFYLMGATVDFVETDDTVGFTFDNTFQYKIFISQDD